MGGIGRFQMSGKAGGKLSLDSARLATQTQKTMNIFGFKPVHIMIRRGVKALWRDAVRPRKAKM